MFNLQYIGGPENYKHEPAILSVEQMPLHRNESSGQDFQFYRQLSAVFCKGK